MNWLTAKDDDDSPLVPPMVTLQILGGRKEKIRPGDVLGALTGEAGFTREQVGKITVTDQSTYVAVARNIAREAVRKLSAGKVKGKTVKVRALLSPGQECASRRRKSIQCHQNGVRVAFRPPKKSRI